MHDRAPLGPGDPSRTRIWLEQADPWLLAPPRAIRHSRLARTSLRTLHLIAIAALYGGHLYSIEPERLGLALGGVVLSGCGLVALELYRSPVWLVQLRGVATLLKLALLAAVPVLWNGRVWLLTLALAIGSVSSHMPGRWRYLSVLHRRVVHPGERG